MTHVCITVDIEFSIGGAFAAPNRNLPIGEPAVACVADGREHGLGFILETLRSFGLTATFFVEALNYCYFGDRPMAAIAERIMKEGHDVQLHLHPCWLSFRDPQWKTRIAHDRPNDSCAGRSDAELDEMVLLGLDAFRRWGIPRPTALRTGNMQVDRAVYRAMARHNFRASSNVARAIVRPPDSELQLLGGRYLVEGILELPVLTYKDLAIGGWEHEHALTITGCSSRETEFLLEGAYAAGLDPVVVLTHCFEFINRRHDRFTKVRPHRANQRRLVKLCRFVAEHPHKFSATPISRVALDRETEPSHANISLRVPLWTTLGRMAEAQLNDRFYAR